ncbi:MAG TPA: hypothetical protein PKJ41_13255 [Bryobacteraceae bacterium]|nr:hypothetical protein [Bryobacteraceae bacterium]HPT28650.1 hypothetical protein [Bryobacteraceae bacterium]
MQAPWNWIYLAVASAISGLYGLRAYVIFREKEAHERWHQVWFNTAGCGMGWLAGYWLVERFKWCGNSPSIYDFALLVFAALGIVGYLPQTLNAMPGLLSYLGRWTEKKLEQNGETKKAS